MKRDMELARNILQQIEEKSNGLGVVAVHCPGHTEQQVSYHIMQLCQAGLLIGHDTTDNISGLSWVASSLTWEGHEFLDAIRNDTVWSRLKKTTAEKAIEIPFAILKTLGLKYAAEYLGVPMN